MTNLTNVADRKLEFRNLSLKKIVVFVNMGTCMGVKDSFSTKSFFLNVSVTILSKLLIRILKSQIKFKKKKD